jgi:integrase/recombinase XerD
MIIKFAIKEFLDEKEFKNVSPKTLQNYKETLSMFHAYCIRCEIVDLPDVTQGTIKSYLRYCKNERKNKPVTLNTRLLTLKISFNYLKSVDIISPKENAPKKIEHLKTDDIIAVPTDQQIKDILSYFRRMKGRDKTFYVMRDSLMVVTLISSGLRLSEMISLKWENMDYGNGYMMIFGKARTLQGVPMSIKLKHELLEYRVYCEKHFGTLPEFVFTNQKAEQATPDAVKNVFKRVNQAMGFKDISISAHKFRHYYASVLVKNGIDGFTLMGLLRHSDISTSQRYVTLFNSDLSEKNEKFNPLNHLDI